jgi:L-lactate dehydrogenase complex protein LldE
MKIALFITCYNDTLFPEAGVAVVRVLERLGHTVEFPSGQTCCGQMHVNTGYQEEMYPLMLRFVEQFETSEAVVIPSSSCVAMIREFYPQFAERMEREGEHVGIVARVQALLPRVWEFSEFLTKKLGLTDVGAYFPHKVTYHASCHGLRTLGLGDGPESLLRGVRGIELVPLDHVERCCGFGGTFAVKNAEVSIAMLAEKMKAVNATGAEICTACDTSCLMHIGGGLRRQGQSVQTMHLAQILAGEVEP